LFLRNTGGQQSFSPCQADNVIEAPSNDRAILLPAGWLDASSRMAAKRHHALTEKAVHRALPRAWKEGETVPSPEKPER
jgi:hypothetical protein